MEPLEIGGIFVLLIMMTLCTIAGIGGGGIEVPLMITFFSFNTKESVAVTGLSIFMCSMTKFFYSFKAQHPQKEAVIIDYSLATIMQPTVLMGSFLGVLVNVVLPSIILESCLTLLLIFLTVQSAIKARQIYKKENEKAKEKRRINLEKMQQP